MRCEVLSRLSDDDARDQPRYDGTPDPPHPRQVQPVQNAERRDRDQDAADVDAAAERLEQVAHARVLACAHEIDSQDGQNDADAGKNHGRREELELHRHLGSAHGVEERRVMAATE